MAETERHFRPYRKEQPIRTLKKRHNAYLPSNPFPQPPPTLTAGLMVMCGARPPMLVVLISPTANRGGAAVGGISPPLTG